MRLFVLCRLLLSIALAAPSSTTAMEFNLVGTTLVLSGGVADNDLAKIKDNLDPARVKLIVLHQNKGGDLWNAFRIGERIRESGVPTTISGYCNSACAIIFLGGVKRTFSDGKELRWTSAGFHGAYNRTTKEANTGQAPPLSYYINNMTGGRFPKELIEKALYIKKNSDFIYAFHPSFYQAKPRGIMECHVPEDGKRKCTMIEGLDAITIGVITDMEITILSDEVKALIQLL